MDISSVSAILTSIKTATDIAKIIKNSDTTLEKAEMKLKLAELISSLADAKIQVSEIQDEILQKESTIRSLQEQFATKEKLVWEHPYYWLVENGQKEGPFCQHCYDKGKETIRLQGNGSGYWECKVCKNSYTDKTYKSGIGVVRTRTNRDF